MAGLTDPEQEALSSCYNQRGEAEELLARSGFPEGRIPDFTVARSFWFKVSKELEKGLLANGRDQILATMRIEYPNHPLWQGAGATQNPPDPQPPPRSPLWKNPTVLAAIVTVVGGAVIAMLTGLFGLVGQDEPKSNDKPSSSPSSSSVVSPKIDSPEESESATTQTMTIQPESGPAGTTTIEVRAVGFKPNERVTVELRDGISYLENFEGPYGSEKPWFADSNGAVNASIQVPSEICCAGGKLTVIVTSVQGHTRGGSAQKIFTLTE